MLLGFDIILMFTKLYFFISLFFIKGFYNKYIHTNRIAGLGVKLVKINLLIIARQYLSYTLSHWDLPVDKNSFSVSPTDKILTEHVQTVDWQRLAGKHVCCLQAAFTGVSAQPGADDGLVSSSWWHSTARDHTVVSVPWKHIDETLDWEYCS